MQFDKEFLASMVREVWARNTPAPLRGGYVYAQIPVPKELTMGDIPSLEECCKIEVMIRDDGQVSLVFWKLVQPPRLPMPRPDSNNWNGWNED